MSARVRDEAGAVAGTEPTGELDSLLRAPSTRTPATPIAAVCLGRIVALDAHGGTEVEFHGSGGTRRARCLLAADSGARATMAVGQQVVLAFENGDPALPIVLGCIQMPAAPEAAAAQPDAGDTREMQVIEADVDGKRVRIVAQDEIVLQCGNASITLRRNGRVVIRGTYVESYSEGTNRIKGGQVRIN